MNTLGFHLKFLPLKVEGTARNELSDEKVPPNQLTKDTILEDYHVGPFL